MTRAGRIAQFDVAFAFVASRRALAAMLARHAAETGAGGNDLDRVAEESSGVVTDVTEDTVREIALPMGIVDVKVCAIDATWSGLKLLRRRAAVGLTSTKSSLMASRLSRIRV